MTSALLDPARRKLLGKMARISLVRFFTSCDAVCSVNSVQGAGGWEHLSRLHSACSNMSFGVSAFIRPQADFSRAAADSSFKATVCSNHSPKSNVSPSLLFLTNNLSTQTQHALPQPPSAKTKSATLNLLEAFTSVKPQKKTLKAVCWSSQPLMSASFSGAVMKTPHS